MMHADTERIEAVEIAIAELRVGQQFHAAQLDEVCCRLDAIREAVHTIPYREQHERIEAVKADLDQYKKQMLAGFSFIGMLILASPLIQRLWELTQ